MHMIEAGKVINLGEITQTHYNEDDDEDLKFGMTIDTLNEGIKADSITINSGMIEIFSNKDSINSNKDIIINGGNLLIFSGNSETENQPFKTNGKTKISKSMIQALGTKCPESEITTQQVPFAYSGIIKKDQKFEIYLQGESILELDERKYNYNFFLNLFINSLNKLNFKLKSMERKFRVLADIHVVLVEVLQMKEKVQELKD